MRRLSRKDLALSPKRRALLEQLVREEGLTSQGDVTIPVRESRDSAPLSFAQQRLWFINGLEPGNPVYTDYFAVRFADVLNFAALEQSINEIRRRHDALRTTFDVVNDQALQVIAPTRQLALPFVDLRELRQELRDDEVHRRTVAETRRPFDLTQGPLLRLTLVVLGGRESVLLFVVHHIISDGLSLDVFIRQLGIVYEAFDTGEASAMPELLVQYGDYAAWQQQYFDADRLAPDLAYWKEKLAGARPLIELPIDRQRSVVQRFSGAKRTFELPLPLTLSLNSLSRQQGVTLFMLLLAAFKAVLFRWAPQNDICVGSPIAGRNRDELKEVFGCFANTLVLRTGISSDLTFSGLLGRVKDTCLQAYGHQEVPFEKLVEVLQPERDLGRTPLFQVMFVFQGFPVPSQVADLKVELLELDIGTAKFDLTLGVLEKAGRSTASFEYSTDLFNSDTIARMIGHFQNILRGISANPEKKIWELPLLSEKEERQIVSEWNETGFEYGRDLCIYELFEEQVEVSCDSIAIIFEQERLSYGELNVRSNQLAHFLRGLGSGPDSTVAICMERSIEMVVAIYGILKAGASYLPLDPSHPLDRLTFMAEDSGASVVLTIARHVEETPRRGAVVLCLDSDWHAIASGSSDNPMPPRLPDTLAYVIYTSGSTGKPKGAMINHMALANHMTWMQSAFPLAQSDTVLQKTPYGFDASVWEFHAPLLVGAGLVLARPGGHLDTAYLRETTIREQITTLQLVPVMLSKLLDEPLVKECTTLKRVYSGGEPLSVDVQDRFYAHLPADLINLYGPTETTIQTVIWQCHRDSERKTIPIGKPIYNIQTHVLDERQNAVPVGIAGELYIGGAGLARGYVNRPDLTAERFLPNPFSRQAGKRLYRTGDVSRFLADGNIEYVGRSDNQVKVRGYRIETGEIEEAMKQEEGVREAVVVVGGEDVEERRLVAYVVMERGREGIVKDLKKKLRARLPEYLVPSQIVAVEKMPLMANGKIDRKGLSRREVARQREEGRRKARNAVEEILSGIWAEVLGVQEVGVEENFFDIGGHSLLATQLVSRIRRLLGVEAPLRALFSTPTVAGMAAELEGKIVAGQHQPAAALERADREQGLPLSFAQRRLWFIDRMEPGNPVYNISCAARLRGRLDTECLQRAITEIVRRHEVLRTIFLARDGEPAQCINDYSIVGLGLISLKEKHEDERKRWVREFARVEATRGFDLGRGPLIRANLLQLDSQESVLFVTMHHIVSDGWSTGLIVRELAQLYESYREGRPSPLEELPVQYADFAVWQLGWLQGDVLQDQLKYWKRRLAGMALLEVPTDKPRPSVLTYRGASEAFRLSTELTLRLKAMSRGEGVTLFMTLLAGFQLLLSRYSGLEDIAVATPIAGRDREETERLVGFFANTLVMRTDLSGAPTVKELMRRTRETALGAYSHQDFPFEKVVEELQPQRHLGVQPLCKVMISLLNVPWEDLSLAGVSVSEEPWQAETAKFDLTLSVVEHQEEIRGSTQYAADLFNRETVVRMLGHLRLLLEAMVDDEDRCVTDIPLLSEQERAQLVVEWNSSESDYPAQKSADDLFRLQVEKIPDGVAVADDGKQISYAELNRRANQLAHYLRSLGVEPEMRVSLFVERCPEMIVGVLGVLKAGAVYVPLDPSYPGERLNFMLQDSGAAAVLTQEATAHLLPRHSARVVSLDTDWPSIGSLSEDAVDAEISSDNLAYVIYTSGSTGRPKGVMVRHNSVINLVKALKARVYADKDPALRIAVNASLCFDASVKQLFQLLEGHTLCLLSEDLRHEPGEMLSYLARHSVCALDCTPSQLSLLMNGLEGSRELAPETILVGGEALEEPLWQVLASSAQREFYNVYGPTEFTVDAAICKLGECNRARTIGRPIANTQIYLLDKHLNPVAVGVTGEIFIGGAGLARGYLGRPDSTGEKFIANPFSRNAGARLYRTGDLARYHRDGNIEFLSRADRQVKVRGVRVELGEIESILTQNPALDHVVVDAQRADTGDLTLVAYVVSKERVSAGALREYLRGRLPEYMIPAAFVHLEQVPLTPNGKLDRRALSSPRFRPDKSKGFFEGARTAIEEMVAETWAEVLAVERVAIHDDFFDLGGHSLLGSRMIARINDTFRIDVPLRRLFETPTVAGLAEAIDIGIRGGLNQQTQRISRITTDPAPSMSFAQQRIWFLNELEPNSSTYNMPAALRLKGKLKVAALKHSFGEIVSRHEVLRTTFENREGQAAQVIEKSKSVHLAITDLSGLNHSQRETRASHLAIEEAARPFDLARGPLLRVELIRMDPNDHLLVVTMHHIVSDGWSVGVFLRETESLYGAFSDGNPSTLDELPLQYADFARWQKQRLEGEAPKKQIAYWKHHLTGELPVLELPTDRTRSATQTFRGARHSIMLPHDLTQSLKSLSRREGSTLFITLLASFRTLLNLYTGQKDILIGTAFAGRSRTEVEGLIGLFANTLILRTDSSGDPVFRDLMKAEREVFLEAYANQEVPFERLVEELQPERSLAHMPLFQVMFLLVEPRRLGHLNGLELRPMEIDSGAARFDITVWMREGEQGLEAQWEYNADLFNFATIGRISNNFRTLLEAIVEDPSQRISELDLLTEIGREQVLLEWNDTAFDYQRHLCMHDLFRRQDECTPDAIAIIFDDQRLTYAELNRRANQLAHYLVAQGVRAESLVGVCLPRQPEMIISLLGILKAGGAYVPLDPAYPQARLAFMLDDADAQLVLTTGSLIGLLPGCKARPIRLDLVAGEIRRQPVRNCDAPVGAEHLAYLIYTSGSTGNSKAVAIEHRSAVCLVSWSEEVYFQDELAGVLASTSICFDLSIYELFVPLSLGGAVILVDNALDLLARAPQADVTLINTVPSAISELVRERALPLSVKTVNLAGEALSSKVVAGVYEQGAVGRVVNLYGPSEDTTYSTYEEIERDATQAPLIGRPIANTRVHILDERLGLVAQGVVGELYIGGEGLARGYYKRAAVTAERFLPDGYSQQAGARVYRTGDIGRYRERGRIEFIGRSDNQVKVRGYRIELGEIEEAMRQQVGVREAAVVVVETLGKEKRLVAYVVMEVEKGRDGQEVRTQLKAKLPEYMVPSQIVELESLPQTANGKIDRKALASRELVRVKSEERRRLRSQVEEIMSGIWADVLGVDDVALADNFFDLGGHSLLATQLVARMREAFRVELELRSLFEKPTVSEFAAIVQEKVSAGERVIIPTISASFRKEQVPLSFEQEGLWFIDQLEAGSNFYNLVTAFHLEGSLSIASLEQTISEISRRHEVLRTTFQAVDGQPVQVIQPACMVRLRLIDLSVLNEDTRKAEANRLIQDEAGAAFDLTRGPLVRFSSIKMAAQEHLALMVNHHIIADAWSFTVYAAEVQSLYEESLKGKPSSLPELALQYADYTSWQRDSSKREALETQLDYWRQVLNGAQSKLNLPTDRPRPSVRTFEGASLKFELPDTLSKALRSLSARQAATLHTALLAAFKVLLHYYSEQEDIIVGSPFANRAQLETERLIGFFVNTLVLRTDLSGDPSFKELLARVREVALSAYAHNLPFAKLVDEIGTDRSLSYNPLFQVSFALDNFSIPDLQFSDLSLRSLPIDSRATPFDLILHMIAAGERLFGSLQYSTDLYDLGTAFRMLRHYQAILNEVVARPEARLSEIKAVIGEADRQYRAAEEKRVEDASLLKFSKMKQRAIERSQTQGDYGRWMTPMKRDLV